MDDQLENFYANYCIANCPFQREKHTTFYLSTNEEVLIPASDFDKKCKHEGYCCSHEKFPASTKKNESSENETCDEDSEKNDTETRKHLMGTIISIFSVVVAVLVPIGIYSMQSREERELKNKDFLPLLRVVDNSIEYTFNSEDEYRAYEWFLANSDSYEGYTDPELLKQMDNAMPGMCGSAVIQNDALVGLVTHIPVDEQGLGTSSVSLLTAKQTDEISGISLVTISNFGIGKALNVQIEYNTFEIIEYLFPQLEGHAVREPYLLTIYNENFKEIDRGITAFYFSTGYSRWLLSPIYQYRYNHIEPDTQNKYFIENELVSLLVRHLVYAHELSHAGVSFEFPISISYNDIQNNKFSEKIYVILSAQYRYPGKAINDALETDYSFPNRVTISVTHRKDRV